MVVSLTVGLFASNCHILWHEGRHDALVIDPGDEAPRIAATLRENRLKNSLYLLTHGHMDHVSGLADLVVFISAFMARKLPLMCSRTEHARTEVAR